MDENLLEIRSINEFDDSVKNIGIFKIDTKI